ncbi:hypothetical protein [Streptomyces ficellus]|uniref:Uncharacterized protein n=1 Tax=Streptomyces ficellus TaxID=1977088 RepID=A0A6I6FGB7_9ACTN|nr:hypothetical protein [Streptomyces ficellus]QGV82354.1 hypothetical protein EIZ62_31940 [Streptomyces ficellus]
MTDHRWDDDGEFRDAVQVAERATRFGWAAIAGAAGVLGCLLIAMAVTCVVAFIACLYVVMAMDF